MRHTCACANRDYFATHAASCPLPDAFSLAPPHRVTHTQVSSGGVMTTNDGASTPVLTANLDMTVTPDGKLVSRTSNSTIATTPAVTRSAISSEAPFELLLKLRNLVVRD